MPYRVHTKIDKNDVVFTSAVLEDGYVDITSDETPALSGDNFRPPVYGDEATAEVEASSKKSKSKPATQSSGGN